MSQRRMSPNELAGALNSSESEGWSAELRAEFARNEFNGRVGTTLLSQSDRVRVWSITLEPGERLPAHRHVLDYFWTALKPGVGVQHTSDGTTRRVVYERGTTRHFIFRDGEYLLHDLENDGADSLAFVTVEFLDSANTPLPPAGTKEEWA
jgi:hypothetical protein